MKRIYDEANLLKSFCKASNAKIIRKGAGFTAKSLRAKRSNLSLPILTRAYDKFGAARLDYHAATRLATTKNVNSSKLFCYKFAKLQRDVIFFSSKQLHDEAYIGLK